MKITQELLEKYGAGECTPEEVRRVEAWLQQTGQEEDHTMYASEFAEAKGRIWEKLSHFAFGGRAIFEKPLYTRILPYAAVACIVIGLFGSAIYLNSGLNNDKFLSQRSEELKLTANINPAEIASPLLPEGIVNVTIEETDAIVDFCGDIVLTNKLGEHAKYKIKTICKTGEELIREVSLKNEEVYYVFTTKNNKTGKNEMHIYDRQHVLMFYPEIRTPEHILKSLASII